MPVKKKATKEKPEKKVKKTSKVEKISKADKKTKKAPKEVETKLTKGEKKLVKVLESSRMDDILDDIEKDLSLVSGFSEKCERISTTLAALDLILNGGLVPGLWYTFAGGEQSSKTTLVTETMGSLSISDFADKIPLKIFINGEGSFDSTYFLNQMAKQGFKGKVHDIFGIKDPNTGKYIKRPIVRKYDESIGETVFEVLARLLRTLPDKLYKNDKWWLVYKVDKKAKDYEKIKSSADAKMSKAYGGLWVETDNPYPQMIYAIDSYPALLPEKQDVNDPNNEIATQARMYSNQIKRVKGKMSKKKVIVLGINQLRKDPMARYGPSEIEPCGEALRFYSDARLRMISRSSVFGNKGKELVEKSVQFSGKKDVYRYVNVKTIKNKTSIPDLETWIRVWVRDGEGKARGYDPVFDSWYFLTQVGGCTGGSITSAHKKVKLSLDVIGVKDWPKEAKALDWADFKRLILCDKETQEKVLKSTGYKGKYFNLRNKILAAGNNPKSFDLFIEQESKKTITESIE